MMLVDRLRLLWDVAWSDGIIAVVKVDHGIKAISQINTHPEAVFDLMEANDNMMAEIKESHRQFLINHQEEEEA